MINLKELAGRKYRVTVEESFEAGADDSGKLWYFRISAKFGHIYVHSKTSLGVYVKGRLKVNMVGAIPGLRLHQRGDDEASYVFPPELLDRVADEIKAKKRRQLSDEQKAKLASRGRKALADFHKLRNAAPEAESDDEAA